MKTNLFKFQKMNYRRTYIALLFIGISYFAGWGQQDPQFTQYMYNTMSVNPAYTGSRGHLTIMGLHRSQWVGLNGAPTTQNLGIDAPVGNNLGLGLNLINDALGPVNEFFADVNVSYTIRLNDDSKKLSFGVRGGGRLFNVDFSKGTTATPDVLFANNIDSRFFPTIGAGIYYHTNKSYLGLSVPNFFVQDHFDEVEQAIAVERMHYFLIAGTVFDLGRDVKLKPAAFVKWVPGAPIIADVSANVLLKETLTLGLAYRWDDSFSGLVGLQITPALFAGYSYDLTTTDLKNYNSGTHEIFLRYEFKTEQRRLKSPRFY